MAHDVRRLKHDVKKAVERGRWKDAAAMYLELAEAEPGEPLWPHRAGEMLRKAERRPEAVAELRRAADLYARKGFTWKAVGVLRLLLEIDPADAGAGERIASLAGRPAQPAKPPRRSPTIPPGQRISAAALGQVFASSAAPAAGVAGPARDIPLEEVDVDLAFPTAGTPAAPARAEHFVSVLDAASLRWLVERLQARRFAAGDVVVRPEDAGAALHLVLSGGVSIRQDGREVERVEEGGFFGEVALVTDLPRYATAVAAEESEVLSVPRAVLADLIDRQPDVLRTLLRLLREKLLSRLVRESPVFAPFGRGDRRAIESAFRFLEVDVGAVLVDEGRRSPGLFVLAAGKVEVVRERDGVVIAQLAELGPGDLFGEISLLTGGPAVATVRALARCWALLLPRDAFQRLVVEHPDVLIYVNDLADRRRRELDEMLAGARPYREGRLELG